MSRAGLNEELLVSAGQWETFDRARVDQLLYDCAEDTFSAALLAIDKQAKEGSARAKRGYDERQYQLPIRWLNLQKISYFMDVAASCRLGQSAEARRTPEPYGRLKCGAPAITSNLN